MNKTKVLFTRFSLKEAEKLPKEIQRSLQAWVEDVKENGLLQARKNRGYHDEPLQGKRKGQRSIRLNQAWRAIYKETVKGLEIIIIDINKHKY